MPLVQVLAVCALAMGGDAVPSSRTMTARARMAAYRTPGREKR
ncbi:MAG: hypothetical protein OXH22_13435 [Chloroflexi bacterium]|nr:hypothetical protein [Chloroflexota bacterium]